MGTFETAFSWVVAHGYFFIFLVMCAEGPVTTAAAGFASALGYFDPVIIYILSVFGDLVPDTIYYYVGYFGRATYVKRLGEKFGFGDVRIAKTEKLFQNHYGKAMIITKLAPLISAYGSILVGYLKLSYRRFITYCTEITMTKSAIFLLVGYFFGQSYRINEYLHNIAIFLPVAAVVLVLLYVGYNKLSALIAKKMESGRNND